MQEYFVLSHSQFRRLCNKNNVDDTEKRSEKINPTTESSGPLAQKNNNTPIATRNIYNYKGEDENLTPPAPESSEPEPMDAEPIIQEPPQEPNQEIPEEAAGLEKDALPLYEFLKKQSPTLDWNQNSELLLSGSLVPESNVFTLINDATNKNGEVKLSDAVWRVFKRWLLNNNVPLSIVNDKVKSKEKLPVKIL